MTVKRVSLAVAVGASVSLLACSDSGADAAQAAPDPAPQTAAPEPRTTQPLMEGWRFVFDNDMSDEEALAATATDWEVVALPHTWNAQDAASLRAEGYERGIGWYRLELPTPAGGARHWLEFGAASLVADVWLNGEKVGEHRGGFTKFRFDVTDRLAASGQNVLLVKVDNSQANSADDRTAIDPIGGDYNKSGGLYRHVALVSTSSAAAFDLGDMGGPGVYAATTAVQGGDATVNVRAKVRSDGAAPGEYTVRVQLIDAAGQVAASGEQRVGLTESGTEEVTQDVNVANAHLWRGVADPYLYQVVAELVEPGGQPVDRVVQAFGVRTIRFDPDEGFFLNGEHVRLNGVAMHQDFLGKSFAVTDEDIDASLALVREIGANFVRLGHYTFPDHMLDRLDELGLVAWSEKPSGLRTVIDGCSKEDPTEEYVENGRQQLQEHIRQQYNHPSVVMWSVANEIEGDQVFCNPPTGHDNVTPYVRGLNALAKEEDPTRPTTLAEFTYGGSFTGGAPPFTTAGITDLLGTNRYYNWYNLEIEEFGPLLDSMHADFPEQPIGISEYGAGAALSHHTDNPEGGPPEVRSAPEGEISYQPEEYAAWVHEEDWKIISSKPYLWGSAIWNMFDFGSDHRNEGDVLGVNTKGMVTFDRQTRKDPFFFYKANWSTEPVTYIVGRRYTDRAYAVNDVRVYSNAASVELRVNDAPVGTMTAEQCPQKTCVFRNVRLALGANRVTATGDHAGNPVTDTVDWSVASNDVNISAGRLTTGYVSTQGTRFGSDHYFRGGEGQYIDLGRDARGGTPKGIEGTQDPMLYKYFRGGDFSYEIPVPDGRYEVTLGFLEPDREIEVGDRVFDVTANDQTLLQDFDVLDEAGDAWTVVTRTFTLDVTGGQLTLDFAPAGREGEAIVSNIKVTSVGAPPP